MASFGTSDPLGTVTKFCPPTLDETMFKGGVSTNIRCSCQCITTMEEYLHKSLEELRFEDYKLNRKGPANGMNSEDATLQKGGLFVSNAKAGVSNATTTAAVFNPSTTISAFSVPSTTQSTFPIPSTTPFTFPNPSTTPFAFPSPSTAPLTFSNSANRFAFSNSTSTAFTFSNPANTALFANANTMLHKPHLNAARTIGTTVERGFARRTTRGLSKVYFGEKRNADGLNKDPPLFTEASTQTEELLCVDELLHGLKEMLLGSKYSDLVVNVKGKEFKAHKNILAAHSPILAAMIDHDTEEEGICVADCEPVAFSNFLDFLYTGKVENLNLDNVLDLYEVAHKHEVSGLNKLCIKYMMNNISIENFCDILTLGLRYHVRELIEEATQFFLQNSKEIITVAKWETFLAQNPVAGNELFLKLLNLKKE